MNSFSLQTILPLDVSCCGDHRLPVSVPIALGVFFSSGPAAADVQRCGSVVVPGMGVKEGKVLVKSSGFNGSAGI